MVLTSNQMRIAEQAAVDLGMNWLRLMENAGSAVAKEIRKRYKLKDKKVVIVCGKGNNGGDGYVVARKLLDDGANVRVISLEAPTTHSAKEMASKMINHGIKPIDFQSYENLCVQYISDCDILVDAIFGIGFIGEVSGIYKTAIATINNSKAVKISVDIPSGLSGDNNKHEGVFVAPDITITFAAYKPCHLLYPSGTLCGKVIVASIGMPEQSFDGLQPIMRVVTEEQVADVMPLRKSDSHKGDFGTAALYVGSKGYAGAAAIAVNAAVKSGAGIVNAIIPNSIYGIVSSSRYEAVCTVIEADDEKAQNFENTAKIVDTINNSTCALIGCGIGITPFSKYTVEKIVKNAEVPFVIDADALNILSKNPSLINEAKSDIIITPHPKEAARLLNITTSEVQSDRIGSAALLTEKTGAITVLKGANTIIALPNGKKYIVTDGNPGMATAGTGDMLAGMIVAFLSQGLSPTDSAICAVKLHAMSGDIAVLKTSELSLTPTDMIERLPEVFKKIYSTK